jgi:hypothetical protein
MPITPVPLSSSFEFVVTRVKYQDTQHAPSIRSRALSVLLVSVCVIAYICSLHYTPLKSTENHTMLCLLSVM